MATLSQRGGQHLMHRATSFVATVRARARTVARRLSAAVASAKVRADASRVALESGQSMVEYAIIIAVIALVALGAAQLLGGGIAQVFGNILSRIQGLGR